MWKSTTRTEKVNIYITFYKVVYWHSHLKCSLQDGFVSKVLFGTSQSQVQRALRD